MYEIFEKMLEERMSQRIRSQKQQVLDHRLSQIKISKSYPTK